MDNNTTMFVITHKKVFYRLDKDYKVIHVGKNEKSILPNYLRDNTGNNISFKNSNYCELTAIYWIWKNYNLPKNIGICHYRRFFVKKPFYKLISNKDIEKDLEKYDVILPYQYSTGEKVEEHFINSPSGRKEDITRLRKLIKEKYPTYYDDFDEVMKSEKISYWNMFVMKKEYFIEYCNWLFELLFEYEKTTNLKGYSVEESRIYGFLSEFLLNVWVKNKKLKVKYYDVLLVKPNFIYNFGKKFQLFIKELKRKLNK